MDAVPHTNKQQDKISRHNGKSINFNWIIRMPWRDKGGKMNWRNTLVLKLMTIILLVFFYGIHLTSASSTPEQDYSKWSKIVCKDLGCMPLAWQLWGVNLLARGMVQEPSILEGFGFSLGEGPYQMSAYRIDRGRYHVSIQSMSRQKDNENKTIKLKTKADVVYPVSIPTAPKGKYTWNSAIQYDLGDQLGIVPSYEMKVEPISFVDFRIQEPDKFAVFGYIGYEKHQDGQMIFKGNNQWTLNVKGKRGAIFTYKNKRWSLIEDAESVARQKEKTQTEEETKRSGISPTPEGIVVFLPVQASGMTYNHKTINWKVFRLQENDNYYFLVQHPDVGTALIDTVQQKMFDAESAVSLPGGKGILVNTDETTPLSSSGVDLLVFKSQQTVRAWWGKYTLSFTVLDDLNVQGTTAAHIVRKKEVQEVTPVTMKVKKEKVSSAEKKDSDPLLLFANSDFEMGDLTNWTATGDAFTHQPTKGDNPTARGRSKQPSRHQGDFWIGTFEKYQGTSKERPGQRQGDQPTGTLTSVPFKIKKDRIIFLVGGGKHADTETVSLQIRGKSVFSATGNHNETMRPCVWDVSKYIGQKAWIEIKDQNARGWGHINTDNFRYME